MFVVEPDKRTLGWCKVKKDYADGSDSMDLVPIGAWHGNGRKAGWWSPILLALRNEDDGTLQAVCKCISGFTDQFYKDLNVTYSPTSANTTYEKPWEYESALTPESNPPSPETPPRLFSCFVGGGD
jgi:DNA ligase-1